jgi:hypothetical protein
MPEVGYVRTIFQAERAIWGEALLEIVTIASISLIPLMGAALREVLPSDSKIYLSDAFEKAFLGGQLLFYALGLIAMVLWQANKDFKEIESFFRWRIIVNLVNWGGVVACAIVIGFDPTLQDINTSFLAPFSVGLFVVSIAFYVLMAVTARVHVDVRRELAETDATLENALRRSRGLE